MAHTERVHSTTPADLDPALAPAMARGGVFRLRRPFIPGLIHSRAGGFAPSQIVDALVLRNSMGRRRLRAGPLIGRTARANGDQHFLHEVFHVRLPASKLAKEVRPQKRRQKPERRFMRACIATGLRRINPSDLLLSPPIAFSISTSLIAGRKLHEGSPDER